MQAGRDSAYHDSKESLLRREKTTAFPERLQANIEAACRLRKYDQEPQAELQVRGNKFKTRSVITEQLRSPALSKNPKHLALRWCHPNSTSVLQVRGRDKMYNIRENEDLVIEKISCRISHSLTTDARA